LVTYNVECSSRFTNFVGLITIYKPNFVFQADNAWKDVHVDSFGTVIENVIRVNIDFQSFSGQDVYVKDLYMYGCQTPRTCITIYFYKCLINRNNRIECRETLALKTHYIINKHLKHYRK